MYKIEFKIELAFKPSFYLNKEQVDIWLNYYLKQVPQGVKFDSTLGVKYMLYRVKYMLYKIISKEISISVEGDKSIYIRGEGYCKNIEDFENIKNEISFKVRPVPIGYSNKLIYSEPLLIKVTMVHYKRFNIFRYYVSVWLKEKILALL